MSKRNERRARLESLSTSPESLTDSALLAELARLNGSVLGSAWQARKAALSAEWNRRSAR